MKTYRILLLFTVFIFAASFSGLAYADSYSNAIDVFKKSPAVQPFFENAYGYALFPTIGKAGIGIGGAYGEGNVYRGGQLAGTSSIIKLSIGWQLGGQAFSEIIFFQDKRAYDEFTAGEFAFDAQASAVFVHAKGGLMYEAAIGGQKFNFTPAEEKK
jgi:lipid-binding SYLF domain-containing protein